MSNKCEIKPLHLYKRYRFRGTKYNEEGKLYCSLERRSGKRWKSKVTGLLDMESREFDVIYVYEGFLNSKHRKMMNWFLKWF